MSESSEKWNVRFELEAEGYTFTRISRKGNPLSRDEVQDWADTQARTQEQYRCVNEVYPVKEAAQ